MNGAADVDGIPVVWIQPDNQDGDARIALWLPWLTGTKETTIPFLAELAGRGFTAVSFDLWQHGERGPRPASRSLPGFRRLPPAHVADPRPDDAGCAARGRPGGRGIRRQGRGCGRGVGGR